METIKIMYWYYIKQWITMILGDGVKRGFGVFRNRFLTVSKQYLNELSGVSPRAGSQPTVETPRDNPDNARQGKKYTSVIIGWILRSGVILSATIISIGLLLLLQHQGGIVGAGVSSGSFPHTLSQVWSGLLMLQPQAIIALGILLLIAIPIATVITSIVAFTIERDRRFVVIAGIVLVILITSLLVGRGGG
jgi:uncharacterized membrane protein